MESCMSCIDQVYKCVGLVGLRSEGLSWRLGFLSKSPAKLELEARGCL